ncbi:MAG: hypothetical protein KHY27_08865, partial [Butyricicoccus pullicaecorum]|nr:hypothetical protein [Butyricicoccus pullicaecorum]
QVLLIFNLRIKFKAIQILRQIDNIRHTGGTTPPVGINLYVASSVGGQPVHKIIPHLPIPLLAIFIGTMLVILIPDIVIFLPNLMNGAAG